MTNIDWTSSIPKAPLKPFEEYLKFIQQNFNTDSADFSDIVKQLDTLSQSSLIFSRMQRGDLERVRIARKLRKDLSNIILLEDFDKYNKFDKLGTLGLDNSGLKEAYRVSDEIIQDIRVARNWIDSYKAYRQLLNSLDNTQAVGTAELRKQLTLLGKSILGRAIELTPMKTGTLRKSGMLLEFDDYIIVAFTAPYAMYVHENLEVVHPTHPSNPDCSGRAKFLEIALQEFFPNATVIINHLNTGAVAVKISLTDLLNSMGIR